MNGGHKYKMQDVFYVDGMFSCHRRKIHLASCICDIWSKAACSAGKAWLVKRSTAAAQSGVVEALETKLFNEAALSAKLQHANCGLTSEAIIADGRLALVFEPCARLLPEVMQRLASAGMVLPAQDTKRVLYQLVSAIAHLHQNNICHQNLRPQSIMLQESGLLKLGGLDSGRIFFKGKNSIFPTFVNVSPYTAPEVILRDSSDFPADIWAIGCICAELVFGIPLFTGESDVDILWSISKCLGICTRHVSIIKEKPEFCRIVNRAGDCDPDNFKKRLSMLDQNAMALLERCLKTDPNKRASAQDLLKLEYFREVNEDFGPTSIRDMIQQENGRLKAVHGADSQERMMAQVAWLAEALAAAGLAGVSYPSEAPAMRPMAQRGRVVSRMASMGHSPQRDCSVGDLVRPSGQPDFSNPDVAPSTLSEMREITGVGSTSMVSRPAAPAADFSTMRGLSRGVLGSTSMSGRTVAPPAFSTTRGLRRGVGSTSMARGTGMAALPRGLVGFSSWTDQPPTPVSAPISLFESDVKFLQDAATGSSVAHETDKVQSNSVGNVSRWLRSVSGEDATLIPHSASSPSLGRHPQQKQPEEHEDFRLPLLSAPLSQLSRQHLTDVAAAAATVILMNRSASSPADVQLGPNETLASPPWTSHVRFPGFQPMKGSNCGLTRISVADLIQEKQLPDVQQMSASPLRTASKMQGQAASSMVSMATARLGKSTRMPFQQHHSLEVLVVGSTPPQRQYEALASSKTHASVNVGGPMPPSAPRALEGGRKISLKYTPLSDPKGISSPLDVGSQGPLRPGAPRWATRCTLQDLGML